MQPITPCIWFQGNAEEAMNYYIDTFPGSKITHIERYAGNQGIPGEAQLEGKVLTGLFELAGRPFMCLDGGPQFALTAGISLAVEFDSQTELDSVWDRLLDGGTPQQCGWITDRFGVTWQIIPTVLGELMTDPNATPEQKTAVMSAMMQMVKLDGNQLKAASEAAKHLL